MPKYQSRRTPCSRSTRRNKRKIRRTRRTRRHRGGRGGVLTTSASSQPLSSYSSF
jgi:hypothetical protein